MMAANEKSFDTVDDGRGAHVRASPVRSGALGVPAERPRGVRGGAPARYDDGETPWRTTG